MIYEDSDVIVINKPAGVLVYPDKYTKSGTLIDELSKHYPAIRKVGKPKRPGIVQRLDRETSGLLLVAKNQKALEFLISQFKKRQVQKKYFALVYGKVKEKSGAIVFSLAEKGRRKKREALTYYRVMRYFNLKSRVIPRFARNDNTEFTLLDVEIKTGVMHQIRQHLRMLGHPIVGDKEYTFKNLKPPYPLDHHFLHAYYLKLMLPDGTVKEFEIGLPKNLKEYLNKLGKT